jgi:ankyrin repeat protein
MDDAAQREDVARGVFVHEVLVAISNGDVRELDALLRRDARAVVEARSFYDERTALHLAAKQRVAGAVDLLLQAGADVHARDVVGLTPLHMAVEGGNPSVVERLLAAGAEVNARNVRGETPLHKAAQHDHRCIASQLLAAGAEASAVDSWGWSPLHHAATSAADANAQLVRALLRASPAEHARLADGIQTPLACAAVAGRLGAARALLAAGADPFFGNEDELGALSAEMRSIVSLARFREQAIVAIACGSYAAVAAAADGAPLAKWTRHRMFDVRLWRSVLKFCAPGAARPPA